MIKLLGHMGSDVTVANVARVSLGRTVTEIGPSEQSLIDYLIRHQHTSPLRHCYATFHIVAPLFVLRQWGKHQVGCAWNEISYRYVQFDAERAGVWKPSSWREAVPGVKQGSGAELPADLTLEAELAYVEGCEAAATAYQRMIDAGVCREQARAILPQAVQSEVIWTASLQALLHFLDLRLAPDAQQEIREYAQQIARIVFELWPVTLGAWRRERGHGPCTPHNCFHH